MFSYSRFFFALLSAHCLALLAIPSVSCASDFEDETLKEVLRSVNVREYPDISSRILGVIPGGYILSIEEGNGTRGWSKLASGLSGLSGGYVNDDFLSQTDFSYTTKEIEMEHGKIKEFTVQDDRNYIYPQRHARVYDSSGQFLTALPRITDLDGFGQIVVAHPEQLDSKFPFYQIRYWTGGAHCCSYSRFISKAPVGEIEFDVHDRVVDVSLSEDGQVGFLKIWDQSYTYWLYSYAGSPIPIVVLKISPDGLVVAEDKMKANAVSVDVLKERIVRPPSADLSSIEYARARSAFLGKLTGALLSASYSGRGELVRLLLEEAWPKEVVFDFYTNEGIKFDLTRAAYFERLREKISESPYFERWMLP